MLLQMIFVTTIAVAIKGSGGQMSYPNSYRGMFDQIPRQSQTKGAQDHELKFEYAVDDGVGNRQYHSQQESRFGDVGESYAYKTVQQIASGDGYRAANTQEAGSGANHLSQAKINAFSPGISCSYGQSCFDANGSGNMRRYKSTGEESGAASQFLGGGDSSASHMSRGGGTATSHLSGGGSDATSYVSSGGRDASSHISGGGDAGTSYISGGRRDSASHVSGRGGAATSYFSGGSSAATSHFLRGVWKGSDIPTSETSGTEYEYDPSHQGANVLKREGPTKNNQSFEDVRLTKFTSKCACLISGEGVKLAKAKGYNLTAVHIHQSVDLSKETDRAVSPDNFSEDNSVLTECDCEFEDNSIGRNFDGSVNALKVSK